jgi:hypothetical protein
VGPDGHHGGFDQVEVGTIPQIGLDDPPPANQSAVHRDGHSEAPLVASSFGSRCRAASSSSTPGPRSFFTWAGFEEMDQVSGSGSAELKDDGSLEIAFAYYLGDEAILKAVRAPSSTAC